MQDSNSTIFDESEGNIRRKFNPGRQLPVLMVLDGGDVKIRYTIDRAEMAIGRDLSCEIVLQDTKSSRRHASILFDNVNESDAIPRLRIRDLDSTNGTFLNGAEITEEKLCDRDKILIGSTLLGFFLRDESTLKAEQHLVHLASSDGLTGLRNRAVFDLEMQREFARARRYHRELSLVILDIDHFKNINDTFGHQAGDLILKEFSQILASSSRVNDLPARYGGEEFAIILPETCLENALIHAERLRKMIANYQFVGPTRTISLTTSIGVAALVTTMDKEHDLVKATDDALYRAKTSGRNQVAWHAPGQEKPRHRTDAYKVGS